MPNLCHPKRLLVFLAALPFVMLSNIGNAQELTLFSGEYEPYTSEKLPGGGPYSVYLQEVFARAGFTLKIEFLPWARAEYFIDNGEVLGAFPYGITETRRTKYLFSKAIGQANLGAVVNINHVQVGDIQHLSLGSLKKYKVLLLRGMYLEEEFSSRKINFQSLNTLAQAINMLTLNRGEIFLEDLLALRKGVNELSVEERQDLRVFKVDSIEDIVISQPFAIMYSPRFPGVEAYISKINQAITELGMKNID
jgi:ABC-type amino acid transport substrate-binding protein